MDQPLLVRALRRSWWIIAVGVIACAVLANQVTDRAQPQYASSVTFFVSTPTEATGAPLQSQQFAQRRINSYLRLVDTEEFAQRIIAASGVDKTVPAVQSAISASTNADTVLFTVTATDPSSADAQAMAAAVAGQLGPYLDSFDFAEGEEAATSYTVLNVLSGPTLNPNPVSPNPTLNLGVGVAVGFLIGLAVAVLRALFDNAVRSAGALQRVAGVPLLGRIARSGAAKSHPVLGRGAANFARAESYRRIRTSLQHASASRPNQVIVVSSATAGEGKTTTAANLAVVFAETGARVLLLEADLRFPRLTEYFRLKDSHGLTDTLGGRPLDQTVQPWGPDQLDILASGPRPANPSELLGSTEMGELARRLRTGYDTIIVDTPPVLAYTDAAVAAQWADGVVLVAGLGKVSRSKVSAAVRQLLSVDANVIGCVATGEKPARWSLAGLWEQVRRRF